MDCRHATVLAAVVSAFAAIAIAWFTFSLRQSTDKLWTVAERQREDARRALKVEIAGMKASIAVADKAANAANESAETLPRLERAYLFLHEVQSDLNWPPKISPSVVTLIFKNHGKTPAIFKEMYWGVVFHPYLPNQRDTANLHGGPLPLSVIVGAGELSKPYPHEFAIPEAMINPIITGQELMCLVGRVVYEDVLGKPHETHFCRQYWLRSERFDFAVSDYMNRYT
jgi:hypothetical protein